MKWKQLLIGAMVSLTISVVSIFAYDKLFSQKIVTFDLKGYIAVLRDLYLAKQIDDEELRRRIDHIEQVVKNTPKRKIIITSDVILGGDRVENLTPEIKKPQTPNR